MKRLSKRQLISSGKMPGARRVRMNISGRWPLSRLTIATSPAAAKKAALLPANLLPAKSLLPLRNLLLPRSLLLPKNLLNNQVFDS